MARPPARQAGGRAVWRLPRPRRLTRFPCSAADCSSHVPPKGPARTPTRERDTNRQSPKRTARDAGRPGGSWSVSGAAVCSTGSCPRLSGAVGPWPARHLLALSSPLCEVRRGPAGAEHRARAQAPGPRLTDCDCPTHVGDTVCVCVQVHWGGGQRVQGQHRTPSAGRGAEPGPGLFTGKARPPRAPWVSGAGPCLGRLDQNRGHVPLSPEHGTRSGNLGRGRDVPRASREAAAQSGRPVPDEGRSDECLLRVLWALDLQGVLQQLGDDVPGGAALLGAHRRLHFLQQDQVLTLYLAQLGFQAGILQRQGRSATPRPAREEHGPGAAGQQRATRPRLLGRERPLCHRPPVGLLPGPGTERCCPRGVPVPTHASTVRRAGSRPRASDRGPAECHLAHGHKHPPRATSSAPQDSIPGLTPVPRPAAQIEGPPAKRAGTRWGPSRQTKGTQGCGHTCPGAHRGVFALCRVLRPQPPLAVTPALWGARGCPVLTTRFST